MLQQVTIEVSYPLSDYKEIASYLRRLGVHVYNEGQTSNINVYCNSCGLDFITAQPVDYQPMKIKCYNCNSFNTESEWFKL